MEYIPQKVSNHVDRPHTMIRMNGITGWNKRFLHRFNELKSEKHLSQDELAAKLHVKQPTVSRWLKGQRTPSLDQFEQLAEAIDTPLEWLMFGAVERVTDDERELLSDYRTAEDRGKDTIRTVAHMASCKQDRTNSPDANERAS